MVGGRINRISWLVVGKVILYTGDRDILSVWDDSGTVLVK